MKETIKNRLESLRELMRQADVDAVIVPQGDPHMSEYLSPHWQLRRWLSGFNGSAGDLLVTPSRAMLWTDSRYFLQAGRQLDGTGIELMKDGLPETPSMARWLCTNLTPGQTVAVDGLTMSTLAAEDLRMRLAAEGIALRTDFDPAAVWTDRPALPDGRIFEHELRYAGLSAEAKIARVMAEVQSHHATAVFISALDEIAWLLNIRADDVHYNPVATSFLYLSRGRRILFIDPAKVGTDAAEYLRSEGVETALYSAVTDFLKSVPADERVLIDESRTAARVTELLAHVAVRGASPVAMAKACKNEVQLSGIRAAMLRDGVAMVRSLREIEERVASRETITELDVAEILRRHRSASPLFFDESFGTIAGYGPHGAIVHYEADRESASPLAPEGLLLIDSGAQYMDGTTDITRTVCLGSPTLEERRDFTLVMKGHIALARAVFPAGTTGTQLDVLARQYLWREGLSYLHGTGHGVGHFLNVHEGPQGIRLNHVPAPLSPGMVTSDEPGLYREGVHGIRCENLVLTVPAMSTEFGEFLRFETLTLCPFDLRLFDTALMSNDEIEWVNQYHDTVRRTLAPELEGDDLHWLQNNTAPLPLHTITD